MSNSWQYTIRIGFADGGQCVWQIVDDAGVPLLEGLADDIADATVKVAQAILSVEDDHEASGE